MAITATRLIKRVVLSLLLAPAIASAQTQCLPNNPGYPAAGMTCYDNSPPPMPSTSFQSQTIDRRSLEEQCAGLHIDLYGTCRRIRAAKARRDQEMKDVSSLIASGDCAGAVKRALAEQDLDTAAKAKTICTPSGPPSPAAP